MPSKSRYLLGDLGGTHLRLCVHDGQRMGPITVLKVADYAGLVPAIQDFCAGQNLGDVSDMHFLLSCGMHPRNGVVSFDTTHKNNHWSFVIADVAPALGMAHFEWVHDFRAMALASLSSHADVFKALYAGHPEPQAARLIMGAGTGLGHGLLWPTGARVQETHGGHFPLMAVSDAQRAVFEYLRSTWSQTRPLIFEDVLSGAGLYRLYVALCAQAGVPSTADTPAALLALGAGDVQVRAATCLFAEFLGLYAHIVCAAAGAYGGVYITGGVVERLQEADLFDVPHYMAAFNTPMVKIVAESLARTPHFVVGRPHTALYGLEVYMKQQQGAA